MSAADWTNGLSWALVALITVGCDAAPAPPRSEVAGDVDVEDDITESDANCELTLTPGDGLTAPGFVLTWVESDGDSTPLLPPTTLTAVTSFFHGPDASGQQAAGVEISVDYAVDSSVESEGRISGAVVGVPVERTDGHDVEEAFRPAVGEPLMATLAMAASWGGELGDRRCAAELQVPFRSWGAIDETQDCGLLCAQPEQLRLPTESDLGLLDQDVADTLSDMVTVNTYMQAGTGNDNFTLVQLPMTGTVFGFTRVGQDLLDVWDDRGETSDLSVLNCSTWSDGRETVTTQSFPNSGEAVNIVFDRDNRVERIAYTHDGYRSLTSADRPWLHHNCVVSPFADLLDMTPTIYGLHWGDPAGLGNVWDSGAVSFQLDPDTGEVLPGMVVEFEPNELTLADYAYGNGLSIGTEGADGSRWMGLSYANENHSVLEAERAFFLALEVTEEGLEAPRLGFVNADEFDSQSLAAGWRERFPELELVGLPADPGTGARPIDFPHNIELFHLGSDVGSNGTEVQNYRLVIASLGGGEQPQFAPTAVRMYEVSVTDDSAGTAAQARFFCATVLPEDTRSHFDFITPLSGVGETGIAPRWIGAYTSNPYGNVYWLDLMEPGPETAEGTPECAVVGSQTVRGADAEQAVAAQPVWATEMEPARVLGSGLVDVRIRYNAEVLSGAVPG